MRHPSDRLDGAPSRCEVIQVSRALKEGVLTREGPLDREPGRTHGEVIALQICPGHRLPMRPVDPALFVTDRGLEGDRHARAGSRRQILLIEGETLDVLGLEPGLVKENVTTRGIDLAALPGGSRIALGDEVVLWLTGPCGPCGRMDEIREGLQEEIRGRRGTLAWVERGGRVAVGGPVRVLSRGEASGNLSGPNAVIQGTSRRGRRRR